MGLESVGEAFEVLLEFIVLRLVRSERLEAFLSAFEPVRLIFALAQLSYLR